MTDAHFPSGWYQDPTGQGEARYWNGVAWTDSVNRGGVTVSVPISAEQASIPPMPGSEARVAAPATAPASSPRRTSPWAVVLGVAAIILLVVLVVLLINNDDDGDGPTPPDTGTPDTNSLVTTPATEAPSGT